MDNSNDIKALMAIGTAQTVLLTHLYKSHFATNPDVRATMPNAIRNAAMFMGPMPKEVMEDEVWVDVQARAVLYLQALFDDVEALVRKDEAAHARTPGRLQ